MDDTRHSERSARGALLPCIAMTGSSSPSFLTAAKCDAFLHDPSHLFHKMWGATPWTTRWELPCWAAARHQTHAGATVVPRSPGIFFSDLQSARHCNSNWCEGNFPRANASSTVSQLEHLQDLGRPDFSAPFLATAPALLGFDESVHRHCNTKLGVAVPFGDFEHAASCTAANRNILWLKGGTKYNLCRNLEWEVCAARGLLPSQSSGAIVFAPPPHKVTTDGSPPLDGCRNGFPLGGTKQPPKCGSRPNESYNSADVYFLELCLLNALCENGASLFHRNRTRSPFRCKFSESRLARLLRILTRTAAPTTMSLAERRGDSSAVVRASSSNGQLAPAQASHAAHYAPSAMGQRGQRASSRPPATPASKGTGGSSSNGQLAPAKDIEAALQDIEAALLKPVAGGGVVLRIWECSLSCVPVEDIPRNLLPCAGCDSAQACVALELSRRERTASLLRWDLPLAIFNNGRCAPTEKPLSVPSAGVGWVFKQGSPTVNGAATSHRFKLGMFPHDAGTYRQHGPKHHRLHRCTDSDGSADDYALARLRAKSAGESMAEQKADGAHTLAFLKNSSLNCFSTHWDHAIQRQQAYAERLADQWDVSGSAGRHAPTRDGICNWLSGGGGLYNQVHTSWSMNASRWIPFHAIFYVNASARASTPTVRGRALLSAAHALHFALAAQRTAADFLGRILPVVQYRASGVECYDPRPSVRRLRGKMQRELDVHGVFSKPPAPQEVASSTLLSA